MPGATGEDRERNLPMFPDRVASASPRLLLAPDAEVAGSPARLRGPLLEVVEQVVGLRRGVDSGPLTGAEATPLADVLGLLVGHG